MSLTQQMISGQWWRFDRYEIADGYIRPAGNAHLEAYNPWENFSRSKKINRGQPPYQGLIEVLPKAGVHKVVMHEGDSPLHAIPLVEGIIKLPADAESCLLNWCSEYGLLGILIQKICAVTLAPRWKELSPGIESPLVPTQMEYSRCSAGWEPCKRYNSLLPPPGQRSSVPRDGLVSQAEMGNFSAPHVICRGTMGRFEKKSLSLEFGPFFPSVPQAELETFEYPEPLSDAFWHLYCEPIYAFLLSALRVRSCAQLLNIRYNPHPIARVGATDMLNTLLASNTRTLRLSSDGRIEQNWYCSSLLSSLGEMVLADLSDGRFVHECPGCHIPFVSPAYQAQYCSRECRHREQKRDWRRRTAQAEKLFAVGKGVKEVATEMGEKPRVVRTWYRNFRKRG